MEAIVHLIGAVIHGFVLLAEIVLRSVIFQIEAIRYGYNEALVRSNRRQADGISPLLIRLTAAGLLFASVGSASCVLYAWNSANAQRVATTEKRVDRLAEQYYQATTKPDAQFDNGLLNEVDAWGKPLRLETEKSLFGWWVVVSSDGPDGRPATSDDVKSVRANWSNLEQVGGELAQRGADKAKDKIKALFTRNKEGTEEPAGEQELKVLDAATDVVAGEIIVKQTSQGESNTTNGEEKEGFKIPFKFRFGKSD